MSLLIRALSAEALKLRGTLALWMCLIAPATVVALYVLQMTFMDYGKRPALPPADAWKMFAQSVLVLWALLMLPLFVTLEAALLAGLEHANQQWKHLLALPLPRGMHYLAKLLALLAMVALAMVCLLLLIPLGGWVLDQLQPRFGIDGPPPWEFLLTGVGACLVAALMIIAIHAWVSIRARSFTVAVSFGMTATVAGFLIGQSARFGHFYPWSMPLHVFGDAGEHLGFVMVAGAAGGLAFSLLGLWDFLRREAA
jgi:hypothetical protein